MDPNKEIFDVFPECIQHKHIEYQMHPVAVYETAGDEPEIFVISAYSIGVEYPFKLEVRIIPAV